MELLAAISTGNLRILVAPSGCSIVSMGAILYCISAAGEIVSTSMWIIILCQSTCKEDKKKTLDGTTLGAYEATTCCKIGVHSNFNWKSKVLQVPPSDYSIVLIGVILDYF